MKEDLSEMKDLVMRQAKEDYGELLNFLRRERDELRVRMHLAGADAQDQWHKVEVKWEHFQSRAAEVAKVTEDSTREVAEATHLLGEEIKEAYRNIRNSLER